MKISMEVLDNSPKPWINSSKSFINIDTCESEDISIFFDNDKVEEFKSYHTMAHLVTTCGLFPSISQAKKNGWDVPIPKGFNCVIIGKKRKFQLWILNSF